MAISPPSDLVLDVVRAADPTQVQAAQEKLKANRAAFRATSLADAGAGFSASLDQANSAAFKAGMANPHGKINRADVPKAYKQYEAVFLQNFVKTMLPQDSEEVYGKGVAGDMWKSMTSEQLGEVLSQGQGIGIAEQMYAQALQRQLANSGTQTSSNDSEHQAAMSLVTDLQRRTFGVSDPENDKSSRA